MSSTRSIPTRTQDLAPVRPWASPEAGPSGWTLVREPPKGRPRRSATGPSCPSAAVNRQNSGGLASWASWSACCGNHAPAAGSAMLPHSGSVVLPATLRVHCPSDCPGVFTHREASSSAFDGTGFAAGRSPRPRPGGLHQSCAVPALVYPAAAQFQGPRPLRLVSMTKCLTPATFAYRALRPDVLSAGLSDVSLHSP